MSVYDDLEGADRRSWSDATSSLTLIRVPPRVSIIRPEGRAGEGAAAFWKQHDDWLVCDDMLVFFDAEALSFAGSSFISQGSSMTLDARPRMTDYHVLIANVMIEMIAKTINLSMGGFMTIHRARPSFDAALADALALQSV